MSDSLPETALLRPDLLQPIVAGEAVPLLRKDAAGQGTIEAGAVEKAVVGADVSPPVVVFSDNLAGTANLSIQQLTYTLTFDEPVTGLAADDFTLTNASLVRVTGSGSVWQVAVAPTAGVGSGSIALTLKAGAVSDAAGNFNAGASDASQAIDTRAPVAPKLVQGDSMQFLSNPGVTVRTNLGDLVVELFAQSAPVTVANLLAYVKDGFYDGLLFHRVIAGFVAQAGGWTINTVERPDGTKVGVVAPRAAIYPNIPLESDNHLSNLRGTIAMARQNLPDTAASEFYFNLADNTGLDYRSAASPGYAVFGTVRSGLPVLDAMALVPTSVVGSLANFPNPVIQISSMIQSSAGNAVASWAALAVDALEQGASWSYSLDAGATWSTGQGASFDVTPGQFAVADIRVRQVDAAGNSSQGVGIFPNALRVLSATGADAPVTRIGGPLADTIVGDSGNDLLRGLAGNDRLFGGPGDDELDGGDGRDTVLYSSLRGAQSVTVRTDGTLMITGPEGSDILRGIERAAFAGGAALGFDVEGTGGQAYRLYQAAFDRVPDEGGLGFWIDAIDRGMSLSAVAAQFIGSAEFASLYGASPTNAQFVTQLYRNVLHRDPEPAAGGQDGYSFWLNALNNGFPRAQELVQFSESPENKLNVIGVIADGFEFQVWVG
jgi:cyclophilin family peptidyl-prolyl cis-trans isomerase